MFKREIILLVLLSIAFGALVTLFAIKHNWIILAAALASLVSIIAIISRINKAGEN
jgi:membrane protein YdbS with pleckstrin-like domain